MWFLLAAAVLTYLIYIILIKPLNYWKKRNVPQRKPWPIFGNVAPFAFGQQSSEELFKSLYDEFPDHRYIGTHLLVQPALLIRDPELIKKITIKDFDHFTDHALFHGIAEVDPEISKSLIMLGGQKWKGIRAAVTPCFTVKKMKFMFTLLSDCAANSIKYFQEQGSEIISIEMKDTFSRMIFDASATCAFGLKVDSFRDKDNAFFVMGNNICNLQGLRALRLTIYSVFPKIMKFLRIPAFPRKYMTYFAEVFLDAINTRKANGIIRPDMIHIFMERRKTELLNETDNSKDLSDESLIAQGITFVIAGFANSTPVMCFFAYELAINPNVQQRLQKEIDKTLEQCNGEITYDALFDMKYMDMAISETLRLWPAGSIFDRTCVKDYIIAPELPNEQPLLIEKGDIVLLSLGAIHHDPKYFPNPYKFDPERFNEENLPNIKSFTNLPFGAGPRNCIAKRFAMMKMKVLFFHLLSKFDIVTTEKTTIPVVQSKFKLNLGAEGGLWLGLRPRRLVA